MCDCNCISGEISGVNFGRETTVVTSTVHTAFVKNYANGIHLWMVDSHLNKLQSRKIKFPVLMIILKLCVFKLTAYTKKNS